VAQSREARGLPPPDVLAERPRLLHDCVPIWNAWWLLSSFRDGAHLGAIRFSLMDCLDVFEVAAALRPRWVRLLAAMENEFRAHMVREVTSKANKTSKEADSADDPA